MYNTGSYRNLQMTLGFCCSHHFTWPRVVKLSISTDKQGYYIDKTYRIIFILQRKKGAVMSGFISFLSVLLTVLVVDCISVLLFNHYVPVTSNHIHCLPSMCIKCQLVLLVLHLQRQHSKGKQL